MAAICFVALYFAIEGAFADSLDLSGSPVEGTKVVDFNFGGNASSDLGSGEINPTFAQVGNGSLFAKSKAGAQSWNIVFKTKPGLLEKESRYRITLWYTGFHPGSEGAYSYLYVRGSSAGAAWRAEPLLDAKPGEKGKLTYELLTETESDRVVAIGIHGAGSMTVERLKIEKLPTLNIPAEGKQIGENHWRDSIGVCAHLDWFYFYKSDAEVMRMLNQIQALGVGWIRIGISWHSLFPKSANSVEPNALRRLQFIADEAEKRHIRVLAILGATPDWASSNPPGKAAWRYPSRKLEDYEQYVRFVAKEFKGRVGAWEIGNETNWADFWEGDYSDYLAELHVASRILRENDPHCCILCAGLAGAGLGAVAGYTRDALPELLKPENASAYDVLALHIYPSSPEAAIYILNNVFDLMREKGVQKPIWITETGFSVFGTRTTEQQAQVLVRLVSLLSMHPAVDRIFIYNERVKCFLTGKDQHSAVERGFGIVNGDFTPRPAYLELQHLFHQPSLSKDSALARPDSVQ